MATPPTDEQQYLDAAIAQVTEMLAKKKVIWTANSAPVFENFDIHDGFAVDPIQFGLVMCGLKLNRLKKRFGQHSEGLGFSMTGFATDPDAEDSLVDLASFALLTLGLVKRQQTRAAATLEDRSLEEKILDPRTDEDVANLGEYVQQLRNGEVRIPGCDLSSGLVEQARAVQDKYLRSDAGKAEILKLAQEMLAEDARLQATDPDRPPAPLSVPPTPVGRASSVCFPHAPNAGLIWRQPFSADGLEDKAASEAGPMAELAEYCPKCGASWCCTLARCTKS